MSKICSAILGYLLVSALLQDSCDAQYFPRGDVLEEANAELGGGRINGLAYSPDGTKLTVARGLHIWIYDVQSGAEVALLVGHTDEVTSVAFSADGFTVGSGSDDNTVRLWDSRTGQSLQTLSGHGQSVWSVAFSPDGFTLASGSFDTTIRMWDSHTGAHKQTLEEHTNAVNTVVFSPDGSTLASGGGYGDGRICLWDVGTGSLKQSLEGDKNSVHSLTFSPDGSTLASGGADAAIRFWDTISGKSLRSLNTDASGASSLAYSPDGFTLASGHNGEIRLWDSHTGRHLQSLKGHGNVFLAMIAFSPDGVTIASVSWRNTILLWDIRTRRPRLTFPQGSPITSIALSHDGLKLAIGRRHNYLAVINPENGRSLILPPIGFRNSAFRAFGCVAFSPDGFTLASGAGLSWYHGVPIPAGKVDGEMRVDKAVLLWDADSGKLLNILTGHTDAVTSVAYSFSAPILASGSSDKTVRLWDARTGSHLRTLMGHTDIVTSVAFAPDGSILASGSSDKTVRVWNALTGEMSSYFQGHAKILRRLHWLQMGSRW